MRHSCGRLNKLGADGKVIHALGHTPGSLSVILPVRRQHVAAKGKPQADTAKKPAKNLLRLRQSLQTLNHSTKVFVINGHDIQRE
jgi:glyoxylase-like metal-dependent hydrolase (beta-lactamase superfamily II)